MRKALFGFLTVLLLSMAAYAEHHEGENPLRLDHPDRYVVKKGDTLWDISETFLKTPWLWPEIWQVNPQIENPHLIYPGDVISLVYVGGKPRLVLQRGDGSRTVKLTPQARIEPLDTVIPAIPLDAIDAFINHSRVVDAKTLDDASYVISGHEGRIISGGGDKLYSRDNQDGGVTLFSSYGVYRPGTRYVDPDTGEELGIEALEVGLGKIVHKEDDVATMRLSTSNEEVRLHDRLLPTEETKVVPTFFPSSPDSEINGKIISVLGGVNQVGQFDVVALNRGERDEIKVGNVMAIYHRGGLVKDRIRKDVVQLPAERAGILMVFRVFEKMSYGLVLKAQRPLAVLDELKNP
ncbi:MAG: LysM peptidoglycan-binding domain-containing protein [Pseudomonadales bacterium]|nr:LysM peptidoglycan-binding domain-containing protein [Pseudomonadales bacterium]